MPAVTVPAHVLAVARPIARAGFECVVVGGPVRDSLLGRTPKDWDLATSATLADMERLFPDHRGQTRYGTTLVLAGREIVEVTTYRTEADYFDHRRPDTVAFTSELAVDLARRDFTMNAIAYDPVGRRLIDLYGGIPDLHARRIRAVGRPSARFEEDALRMLRAVRFAAQLGFDIEPTTATAIARHAPTARLLASERIGGELVKLLVAPHAASGLRAMADLGLVGPALRDLRDGPRFRHGIATLEQTRGSSLVERAAALLHGVRANSPGLAAERLLLGLGIGADVAEPVRARIDVASAGELASDRALLGAVRRAGAAAFRDGLALRAACDRATGGPSGATTRLTERTEALLASGRPIAMGDLAITGDDLIAAGIRPGPAMGRILRELLEAAGLGELRNERQALLEQAMRLAA